MLRHTDPDTVTNTETQADRHRNRHRHRETQTQTHTMTEGTRGWVGGGGEREHSQKRAPPAL